MRKTSTRIEREKAPMIRRKQNRSRCHDAIRLQLVVESIHKGNPA